MAILVQFDWKTRGSHIEPSVLKTTRYEAEVWQINESCGINNYRIMAKVKIFGRGRFVRKQTPEFDVIVTAESKGIPLAYEMARQVGTDDYIVARKGAKLYMENVITVDVNSITTDHIQTLCFGQKEADMIKGKRVLIVDDVISTGESLRSIEALVNAVEGNIVGEMAVLAEGEAADRDDIIFLEKLPLFNAEGEPL